MILVGLVLVAFTALHCLHYWLIDQPRERELEALYKASKRKELERLERLELIRRRTREALDDPPQTR